MHQTTNSLPSCRSLNKIFLEFVLKCFRVCLAKEYKIQPESVLIWNHVHREYQEVLVKWAVISSHAFFDYKCYT